MVHDWFVHKTAPAAGGIDIPLAPGDTWPHRADDRRPDDSLTRHPPVRRGRPRTPIRIVTGGTRRRCTAPIGVLAARLRSGEGGKLKVDASGLLPVDPDTGIDFTGFSDNWWVGLAMLHTLFTLEHNYICDLLAARTATWNDDQIYAKAKLINAAILAKIHTLEWTCAIVSHPVVKIAMKANWSGLLGEDVQDVLEFLDDQELLGWHRRIATPIIMRRRIR